ncbi:MAG TPA: OmpH family outer membrane protein [Rhodobacteraceae bacterium]|nr:OmpH family outer membrane protein [Paracoccaceae bacterium]
MLRALTLWFVLLAPQVNAQDFPIFQAANILIVSQEDLFANSALGKDILQLEQDERDILIEDGREIGAAFVAEEQRLTLQRDTLPPEEFQALAEAFDKKVVSARAAQETNDANLIANIEARRRAFFGVIAPILAQVMQRYNATVIIDRRSALLFDRNLDITREAIEFLDKAYSENPDMITQLGLPNE